MEKKPYLTIVATTRNDNHGGDLTDRTICFVEGIYRQAAKYNLDVELIIVEWNPPKDKPLLKEILPAPDKNTPVTLRFIVFPEELHKQYKNADAIPLYQMTAKNIGIRRAQGEYVLCTNVDLLFSDECFRILSQKKLKENAFYRTNRCDIPKDVLTLKSFDERLNYGKKNIIKRLGKSPGHEATSLPRFIYYFPNVARLVNFLIFGMWKLVYKNKFPHFMIDFEACGDFTLMSKKDWLDIEGYVELDMYSIHIDSMGLWAACALGKKQVLFPYEACVYHIDHENGWESQDVIKTLKFLESKPCLDYSLVFKGGMYIVEKRQTWGLNKPDWGFANEKFKEYIFEPGKEMVEIN